MLSIRCRLFVVSAAAVLSGLAVRAPAQDIKVPAAAFAPMQVEQVETSAKETGFTLGKLLDSKLLILVKPPLPLGTLNQLSGSPHRSGAPPELLTPGNTGIAVRLRW